MLAIPDESKFIQQLRTGDEEAFIKLVEQHHASLMRMAMIFVSQQSVAEELVQDTWIAVIKGIQNFEGRSSVKTWIFAIMSNKAKKRATRDAKQVNLSAFGDQDIESLLDPDEGRHSEKGCWTRPPQQWRLDPEQSLERARLIDFVKHTIDQLPPQQCLVMTMRDVQGFQASEVEQVLELSAANQRVILHRARKAVRAAIEDYMSDQHRLSA